VAFLLSIPCCPILAFSILPRRAAWTVVIALVAALAGPLVLILVLLMHVIWLLVNVPGDEIGVPSTKER